MRKDCVFLTSTNIFNIYHKRYTERFTRQWIYKSLDKFKAIDIITVAMVHKSVAIAETGSAQTRQNPEPCAPSVSRFRDFWEIFLPVCLHLGPLTARCVWMISPVQLYHPFELISPSLWKKKSEKFFSHKFLCRFCW